MKKRKVNGKLNLDKLTIAKLSNNEMIKGGGVVYITATVAEGDSDICFTIKSCSTVTGIGATTVSNRPTEKHTECNCGGDL